MDDSLTFATQLARETGQLLLGYFNSNHLHTHRKEDHSLVTDADIAADQLIKEAIQKRYPDDWILSEELHPSYVRQKPLAGKQVGVWIIDPLDGTTNFSLGLHYWGILIARIMVGQPQMAVMYFPLLDELYTAQRGQGAYLNASHIQVEPPDPTRPWTFFSCCSRTHRRYHISIPYKTRILGSAGYSLCAVARGTALISFEATPKIWDLAAGWLLINEAGGIIETIDQSQPFPLKTDVDYSRQSYPTLASATPELAARARLQILPK
jgi:myo-inositol-1(or 4)-monophosphatase